MMRKRGLILVVLTTIGSLLTGCDGALHSSAKEETVTASEDTTNIEETDMVKEAVKDQKEVTEQVEENSVTEEVLDKTSLLLEIIGTYSYSNTLKDGTSGTLSITEDEGVITVTDYCDDWSDYRFTITQDNIVSEDEFAVYVKCDNVNSKSEDCKYLIIEEVEFGIDVYCCDENFDNIELLYNAQ